MAFGSPTVWEARTTGSDANGGGFDPVSYTPGTDYSVQDAPQIAFTDLVIDAVNVLKCTSAANPFTSDHVGNIINITGGAGFNVQRVQIISVVAGVATVVCQGAGTSLGTLGSTGGTGNLGGGLATIQQAASLMALGNKCFIKGTHTITATISITLSADNFLPCKFIGYDTNRSEFNTDTRPIITTATNSVALITFNGANGITFRRLKFTSSAATKAAAIQGVTVASGGSYPLLFRDCIFGDPTDKLLYALLVTSTASANVTARYENCEIQYCTSYGIYIQGSNASTFNDTWIHHNTTSGFHIDTNSTVLRLHNCIISDNGSYGINLNRATTNTCGIYLENCVLYNNPTANFRYAGNSGSQGAMIFKRSIFYGVGANTNINYVVAGRSDGTVIISCAFGGSGAFSNLNCGTGEDAITLSANPFTNAATGDFSLNTTAGGGAACRGISFPLAQGSTPNYPDVGASRHQDPPGGAGGIKTHPGMAGGMNA